MVCFQSGSFIKLCENERALLRVRGFDVVDFQQIGTYNWGLKDESCSWSAKNTWRRTLWQNLIWSKNQTGLREGPMPKTCHYLSVTDTLEKLWKRTLENNVKIKTVQKTFQLTSRWYVGVQCLENANWKQWQIPVIYSNLFSTDYQ